MSVLQSEQPEERTSNPRQLEVRESGSVAVEGERWARSTLPHQSRQPHELVT